MYELKIYRGAMCHDNEEQAKFEEELTYFRNFDPGTQKSKKFAL